MLRGFKSFLWNVPVDDENHMMFFLFIAAHLPPEVGATVAEGVREARKYLAQLRPVDEVVARCSAAGNGGRTSRTDRTGC